MKGNLIPLIGDPVTGILDPHLVILEVPDLVFLKCNAQLFTLLLYTTYICKTGCVSYACVSFILKTFRKKSL